MSLMSSTSAASQIFEYESASSESVKYSYEKTTYMSTPAWLIKWSCGSGHSRHYMSFKGLHPLYTEVNLGNSSTIKISYTRNSIVYEKVSFNKRESKVIPLNSEIIDPSSVPRLLSLGALNKINKLMVIDYRSGNLIPLKLTLLRNNVYKFKVSSWFGSFIKPIVITAFPASTADFISYSGPSLGSSRRWDLNYRRVSFN